MQKNKEELTQQLLQLGLAKECLEQDQCNRCLYCSAKLGNNVMPVLLECGHVSCQECLDEFQGNKCLLCQKDIAVKIKEFSLLLEYIKFNKKPEQKMIDLCNRKKEVESELVKQGLAKTLEGNLSQCKYCKGKYGKEKVPVLMNCGHLICRGCLQWHQNTKITQNMSFTQKWGLKTKNILLSPFSSPPKQCVQCDQDIQVKQKEFRLYLNYIELHQKIIASKAYVFAVKCRAPIIQAVVGPAHAFNNWQEVLTRNRIFNLHHRLAQSGKGVRMVINGTILFYSQVKHKTIFEVAQQNNVQLYDYRTTKKQNSLTLTDLYFID